MSLTLATGPSMPTWGRSFPVSFPHRRRTVDPTSIAKEVAHVPEAPRRNHAFKGQKPSRRVLPPWLGWVLAAGGVWFIPDFRAGLLSGVFPARIRFVGRIWFHGVSHDYQSADFD